MSNDDTQPSFATLLDWLEGRLDDDDAAAVAAAVARGDARTQNMVDWLRRFLKVARAMPLHPPPPIVAQNLRQHFSKWCQAQAALGRSPTEVTATLQFDSRLDVALVGVRSADDEDGTVHLAFTSEVADLVIDAHRLPFGRFRLDGQVLPVVPSKAPVFAATASGPGIQVRTLDGDELGRFTLNEVPDRITELRVSNGEFTIVAAVDLGERP